MELIFAGTILWQNLNLGIFCREISLHDHGSFPPACVLPPAHPAAVQPSFRKRFFDYVRTDPKFERSTFRSVNLQRLGQRDKTMENLHQQLASYLLLRASFASTNGTDETERGIRSVLEERCDTAASLLDVDGLLTLADFWSHISELDFRVPPLHKVLLDRLIHEKTALSWPQCLQILLYSAMYRTITTKVLDKTTAVILSEASRMTIMDMDLLAFAGYVLKMDFREHPSFLAKFAQV